MRRISGSWMSRRPSTGTAAATSLARRPKRCGGFSSKMHGEKADRKQAAGIAASKYLTWRRRFRDLTVDLIALSESLEKLQTKDPRAAELVKLRFFAGLTRHQAADALGVSVATADNDWAYAKGWLKAELAGTSGSG